MVNMPLRLSLVRRILSTPPSVGNPPVLDARAGSESAAPLLSFSRKFSGLAYVSVLFWSGKLHLFCVGLKKLKTPCDSPSSRRTSNCISITLLLRWVGCCASLHGRNTSDAVVAVCQ